MTRNEPRVRPAPLTTLRLYRASLADLKAPNLVGEEALAYALALVDVHIYDAERCRLCKGVGRVADMYDAWDCPDCMGSGKDPLVTHVLGGGG